MRQKILEHEKKIYQWFIFFVAYAFVGWLYEVGLCIFEAKIGFVNRGFLWLPILPVYGFGSLVFLQLYRLRERRIGNKINFMPLIMFMVIIILTTVVELITSYIMEYTIGRWLWDYTGYFMNFEGRISLKSSIRFGIGGMAILYIIHPALVFITWKADKSVLRIVSVIFFVAIFIDLLFRIKYGSNFVQ